MPERLVAVRRYLYRELAGGDEELLAADGIATYLKQQGNTGIELMVAERDVGRAKRLLESAPQLVEGWRAPPLECPNCRSSDADSRPPYVLMAFAIGFTCSAVLIAVGYRAGGAALTVLTVVVLFFLWPLVPRWQCRGCGATYAASRPKRP